jgi:hypothetical protein
MEHRNRHHNVTGGVGSAILLGLTIGFSLHLHGQENPVRSNPQADVARVPFVGCNADGQAGPLPPPSGSEKEVRVSANIAKKLAYYESEATSGVLAPRGWYCFGAYGSSGATLFVPPKPFQMDPDHPFAAISKGFTGPVIELEDTEAGGSGSYAVARILAHAFPKQKGFVDAVRQDIQGVVDLARDLKIGPYPGDRLVRRSDQIVEFRTPPYSEGLGTLGRLKKDRGWIDGVALIQSPTPNLRFLNVRLPPAMEYLSNYIVRQVELEWNWDSAK